MNVQNLLLAISLVASAASLPASAAEPTTSEQSPELYAAAVKQATKLAGTWVEDQAQREEWNQRITWGPTIILQATPGKAGGKYVMIYDGGKKERGAWTTDAVLWVDGSVHFGLSFGRDEDAEPSYDAAADSITVRGDHDEASSVFYRSK